MAVTLTLIGKTPGQTQFGLDTFTEHYKCDATANLVLTDSGVPQLSSAHPDYAFMFVTNRNCMETSESASALDLVYTGCLLDDGGGNPVLPASQSSPNDSVLSATSNRTNGGTFIEDGASVQYYAPASNLSWLTYNDVGDIATVPDPTGDVRGISLVVGSAAITGITLDQVIEAFFSTQIVGTVSSTEIVSGKFWQNRGTKTKNLLPSTVNAGPGFYVIATSAGTGYSVGDVLTVSDGGESATLLILFVTVPGFGFAGSAVLTNTFTHAVSSPVAATGGTGSGAEFIVMQVT